MHESLCSAREILPEYSYWGKPKRLMARREEEEEEEDQERQGATGRELEREKGRCKKVGRKVMLEN